MTITISASDSTPTEFIVEAFRHAGTIRDKKILKNIGDGCSTLYNDGNPDDEEKLEYTLEESLKNYRLWVLGKIQITKELDINELRGKNLACWCPLNKPCHADFLLELANN